MATFNVAHIREQGQDMVIVPMNPTFGAQSQVRQDEICSALQIGASQARLRGKVVPVWDGGGGRMAFIAPVQWHAYFRSISLPQVFSSVNYQLHIG